MAPDCPRYLKICKELHHHYGVWENAIPLSFHMLVKKNCGKEPQEIFDVIFKKGNEFSEKKYERTKEDTIEYITKLKKAYEEMK